jgi:hypothetical protein
LGEIGWNYQNAFLTASTVFLVKNFNNILIETLRHAPHLHGMFSLDINEALLELTWGFLSEENLKKKNEWAEKAIGELCKASHVDVSDYLGALKQSEEVALTLDEYHRDHLVHSFYVYLLGHYLIEIYEPLNDLVRLDKDFVYRWLFAAALHDIAYPQEIFSRQLSRTQDKKSSKKRNWVEYGLHFNPRGLTKYESQFWEDLNSFVTSRYLLHISLYDYFKRILYESGYLDHGVLGAIRALKLLCGSSRPSDWELEIAAAILLHNVRPTFCVKTRLDISPLAFLLILADELQEWDRPSLARSFFSSNAIIIKTDPFNENRVICIFPCDFQSAREKTRLVSEKLDCEGFEVIFKPAIAEFA